MSDHLPGAPDETTAPLERAIQHHTAGEWTEAEQLYQDILDSAPGDGRAWHHAGVLAWQRGEHSLALERLDRAAPLMPRNAAVLSDRALVLLALGRTEDALKDLDRAVALDPDLAEAWISRGNAQFALGNHEAALRSFNRAVVLRPRDAAAWNNRCAAMLALDRAAEALASNDQALSITPDDPGVWANRTTTLLALNEPQRALEALETLAPPGAETEHRKGLALRRLGRPEAALACFDAAVAMAPGHAAAQYNRALMQLMLGQFEEGWRGHEWRWRAGEAARNFDVPLWLGGDEIMGKTILLHAGQGLGDTIQFCRYAIALSAVATVVLEVPASLMRLMSSLPGRGQVIANGTAPPPIDLHCPLMSLPLAFETTVDTVPYERPYLGADPAAVAAWRARLAPLPGRRIGLVWAGGPRPDDPVARSSDRRRSMTLRQFAPLADVPGLSFVSLQVGVAAAQTAAPPDGMAIHDWTSELGDFADTAALVEALDLVITVDTAVAHLAGAMGKPVWILNRFDACWRWLTNREDSPWYPSARLFRQDTPGDWGGVMQRVAAALIDGTA